MISTFVIPHLLHAAPIPPDRRIPATTRPSITAPGIHMPTDVAVDSKGRIFLADGANDRILRFTPDGKLDLTIEGDDQKLRRPVGVTIDAKDQLYIADTGNSRIVIADDEGAIKQVVVPPPMEDTWEPTKVAITPDGARTYIVDNRHHRLFVRDNESRKWTTLGGYGQNAGQFEYPFMLCVGHENYIYISEAIGSRIQRLSPDNKWAGQIGQWGVELGQLYRPKGVAVDSLGRLFVSDSTLGAIQVFGERGKIEGVLTDPTGAILRFAHPMGLCFDSKGTLYVVELKANRIAVVNLHAK